MGKKSPAFDPTKYHLQIATRDGGTPTQSYPATQIVPFDSHDLMLAVYARYSAKLRGRGGSISQAIFILPGQPITPFVFGTANGKLNPDMWHLVVALWERRPVSVHSQPTRVMNCHPTQEAAKQDFAKMQQLVSDCEGRIDYAATLSPASPDEPIVLIGEDGQPTLPHRRHAKTLRAPSERQGFCFIHVLRADLATAARRATLDTHIAAAGP